jgi:hypothetical protein
MISTTSSTPGTPVRFLLQDELTVGTRQLLKQRVSTRSPRARGTSSRRVECGYIDSPASASS